MPVEPKQHRKPSHKARTTYWIEKRERNPANGRLEWDCWGCYTSLKSAQKSFREFYYDDGEPDPVFRISKVTIEPL
jgi:hypothetical protein